MGGSMTERDELVSWLKRHKQALEKYDSDEVYILAKQNGFTPDLVCEVLSHWFSDRQFKCSYSLRESWHVDREIRSLNPWLHESWDYLGHYLQTGQYFDE